jgi:hypothetical protein
MTRRVALVLALFVSVAANADDAPTTRRAGPKITYKLGKGASEWDAEKRERIVKAIDEALLIYNANGSFAKTLTVSYNPATPTADGNYNGSIRFGGMIGTRVALHEIAHTLGIGQHQKWNELIKNGKWTGQYAIRQLREFDGPDAVLSADRQHFWPYGLNHDREGGPENFVRHVKMVAAFQRDLGIVK